MLNRSLKILSTIAVCLALFVVMLGAYTRLTDAGLGCPDWPGCYGKIVLTEEAAQLPQTQQIFPNTPIETTKAWTEMAHRYAAGSLGFLIFCIAVMFYKAKSFSSKIPYFLIGLVFFQAALGMWTVTLKLLPIVVMGHLLGGMLIFGGLTYFRWQLTGIRIQEKLNSNLWIKIAVLIVFFQIALGGWVSANYAGISCIGFPLCNGQWLPPLDWDNAFRIFSSLKLNYQGGILDHSARVTIQMIHRIGAIITMTYLVVSCGFIIHRMLDQRIKMMAWLILLAVSIQFSLGIINVLYLLPLPIAVAHNGVAALLFAFVLSLHYLTSRSE